MYRHLVYLILLFIKSIESVRKTGQRGSTSTWTLAGTENGNNY